MAHYSSILIVTEIVIDLDQTSFWTTTEKPTLDIFNQLAKSMDENWLLTLINEYRASFALPSIAWTMIYEMKFI